jgi:predicted XRE-type DNA-binding protein
MKKLRKVPYGSFMEAIEGRRMRYSKGSTRRRVIDLLLNTDMTQAEIAEAVGISPSGVSVHIACEVRDIREEKLRLKGGR